MYIKKLVYQNVGPIEDATIEPSFNSDGTPKPLILVGENGTGKSTILSNIVDSFYERAGAAYSNVRENDKAGGYQYFKAILPGEIHVGKQGMFSCVLFQNENERFPYFFKSGDLKEDFINERLPGISLKGLPWKDAVNYKGIRISQKETEKIFNTNVICYFGPDRYEKPEWMGDRYYESIEIMHPSVEQRFNRILKNSITVKNVAEVNLQWLLDVIADSRVDVSITVSENKTEVRTDANLGLVSYFRSSLSNLEKIMASVLGTRINFRLNPRSAGGSRFQICKDDGEVISPSLDALSTGQIALFNLFATIIRYAENNNINNSVDLKRIAGIVVIDEIELHLHSKLQYEVLPKLIQLFPKVQFIITTHAPLFLLGMEDTFGESGFDIYELPYANKITAERFSEFRNAFSYYEKTATYESEVSKVVKQLSNKKGTLVITEGSTDWKHMKAAYEALKQIPEYKELFDGLNFDFFEYEDENSDSDTRYKISMGCKQLVNICKNLADIPGTTRYIFIADNDDQKTASLLSSEGHDFKKWSDNVFSFTLPVPDSRKSTPEICIEHLYSNEEIKTEYCDFPDKVAKRLYLGNEFDKRGVSLDGDKLCGSQNFCGEESISIIDGSGKKKVTRILDKEEINIAMPKSKFASLVYSKTPPFNNFDFKNFIPIFKTIKEIINLK